MERNVLDILLENEIPEPRTERVKIKRLSEHCGEDVIFTIKELPYDKVSEMNKAKHSDEFSLRILLAGLVDPSLKSDGLKAKYGDAPTAAEVAKRMLLPGEIEDLSRAIERLSGFRTITIESIKKKSEETSTSM